MRQVPSYAGKISVPSNEMRSPLLRKLPKAAVCAEVGVWNGNFSQKILADLEPVELRLVDPWKFCPEFPARWYGGAVARSQQDMDRIFARVVQRFEHHPQVSCIRKTSLEAANTFPNGYFDWVYIDASHSFDNVLDDLRAWSQKVRRGGLLAGDDFNWRDENRTFSVRNAVVAFANERGHPISFVEGGQFLLDLRTP